jgi:hypothetical protein
MNNQLVENPQSQAGLNANALKFIAITAMTVDHVTWTLMPGFDPSPLAVILHCIGRMTAPIMFYFIAEGYHYTKNLTKYFQRMFLFAVISHFAYALCFGGTFMPFENGRLFGQTSVIWSLMWGLAALAAVKSENPKMTPVLKGLAVIACCLLALPADWSAAAVLSIVFVGVSRGNFKKQMLGILLPVAIYAAGYAAFYDFTYGLVQLAVVLSFPVLYLYNGQLGKWKGMKWFFYAYYPIHMTILGLIRIYYLK